MVPVSPVDGELMRKLAPGIRMRVIQPGVDIDRPMLEGIPEDPFGVLWLGALNEAGSLNGHLSVVLSLRQAHTALITREEITRVRQRRNA